MPFLTLFLAKLFGLFSVVMALALLARGREGLALVNATLDDRPAILLSGVFALAGGLATVLAHNVWTGGWLPLLVTLLGWAMVVKGAALLVLPTSWIKCGYQALHYERAFPFVMGAVTLLGAALIWGGFTG
jgi:hypothetical protein